MPECLFIGLNTSYIHSLGSTHLIYNLLFFLFNCDDDDDNCYLI